MALKTSEVIIVYSRYRLSLELWLADIEIHYSKNHEGVESEHVTTCTLMFTLGNVMLKKIQAFSGIMQSNI